MNWEIKDLMCDIEVIKQKFHEIEKASSENFDEESDDAKNSIKVAE